MSTPYFISYKIRSNRVHLDPPREVAVHAAPQEVADLVEHGFIVREKLVAGRDLEALRDAADEIEARYLETQKPGQGNGFGGLFVRNIIDEHPVIESLLLQNPVLVSVARAVLGPQVQVHASVLRVAYPELENQGVEWHFHQRVVPDPEPPFFLRPVVLDNLIYLDDLSEDSGPLVVLPGSHNTDEDLPSGDFSDKAGQVVVKCPAGSVVTSHSSLWHRAFAPKPDGGKRRLLIFGYSPVWLKTIDVPTKLRARTASDADATQEQRELVGLSGYY
ncbi:MAG: phytanoyl-CoA dioxygenase family protein [Akkermansiaceae bacterium]|nr:phytanoyl-CoA dioxygenase family protein [Armatimonadota bacterium]